MGSEWNGSAAFQALHQLPPSYSFSFKDPHQLAEPDFKVFSEGNKSRHGSHLQQQDVPKGRKGLLLDPIQLKFLD